MTTTTTTTAPAPASYRPPWKAYRAMSAAALKSLLAYRFQFFMGLLANIFLLLTVLYLWRTILAGGGQSGFSWPQMKAYLLIAFLANTLVGFYVEWRMAVRIRDGMVAIDLTKPVDYQRARFAETVGFSVVEYSTGVVVALVAGALFGGVPAPDASHLAWFLLSIVLVLPLKFSFVYMTALLCFWTQNYMGINWARTAISNLLSGAIVPLVFFPGWLRGLSAWLPFQGMVSTPALLFIGRLSGGAAWTAIGVQAGWLIVLWWGARAAWQRASRRLTVHGG